VPFVNSHSSRGHNTRQAGICSDRSRYGLLFRPLRLTGATRRSGPLSLEFAINGNRRRGGHRHLARHQWTVVNAGTSDVSNAVFLVRRGTGGPTLVIPTRRFSDLLWEEQGVTSMNPFDAAGDFNGDGRLDIALRLQESNNPSYRECSANRKETPPGTRPPLSLQHGLLLPKLFASDFSNGFCGGGMGSSVLQELLAVLPQVSAERTVG